MAEETEILKIRPKKKSKTTNTERASLNQLFPEHTCAVCDKHFAFKIGQSMSSYTYKMVYHGKLRVMCCYTCFRKLQKVVELKKKCS